MESQENIPLWAPQTTSDKLLIQVFSILNLVCVCGSSSNLLQIDS